MNSSEKRKQVKEHIKIERLLNLLKLLSSNLGYTYADLSERIGVTERTIYRYINSFKKNGLFIEKKNGYIRLEKNKSFNKDISSLLHFSKEEALLLDEAINSIEATTLTNRNLKNKLFALYNSDRINYPIFDGENSGKLKLISEAIEQKKLIKLIDYKSSNSGSVKDRIVEPFSFTTNHIHLWAFENKFSKNYLFRISRISKVEILNELWKNELKHKEGKTDVFRMAGEIETPFKLKLTMKGFNYLVEQYPLAKQHIEFVNENEYLFEHWYANFHGIAKFILSAMNEVEIVKPKELKEYLNSKIRNKIF